MHLEQDDLSGSQVGEKPKIFCPDDHTPASQVDYYTQGSTFFYEQVITKITAREFNLREMDYDVLDAIIARNPVNDQRGSSLGRNVEIANYAYRLLCSYHGKGIDLPQNRLNSLALVAMKIIYYWLQSKLGLTKHAAYGVKVLGASKERNDLVDSLLADLLGSKAYNLVLRSSDALEQLPESGYKNVREEIIGALTKVYEFSPTTKTELAIKDATSPRYSQNSFEQLRQVAVRYGFQTVKECCDVEVQSYLDPQLPTVLVCRGLNDDTLAELRAFGQTGLVNAVIVGCQTEIDEQNDEITVRFGGVWTENGVMYGNLGNTPVDYLASGDYELCKKMNDIFELPTCALPNFAFFEDKDTAASALKRANVDGLPCEVHLTITTKKTPLAQIREQLTAAFAKIPGSMIVIKPSDKAQGLGVSFFNRDDIEGMVHHIKNLRRRVGSTSIIVQEHLQCMPLLVTQYAITAEEDQEAPRSLPFDWNIRCFVTTNNEGTCICDGMVVRYDIPDLPVNLSTGARALAIDDALNKLDIDKESQAALKQDISQCAVQCMQCIMNAANDGEPANPMKTQDLAGVDVIVVNNSEKPTPKFLEINGANSGGIYNLDTVSQPENYGSAVTNYIARATHRATEHMKARMQRAIRQS